jgi:hypothetical protein
MPDPLSVLQAGRVETVPLTAILTVSGAIVGAAIGAVVGPMINRGATLEVARRTLAGQRVLARDEARRRRREALVQPFLEMARKRPGEYIHWRIAVGEVGGAIQPIVHQEALWQDIGYQTVDSSRFRAAAEAYLAADRGIDVLLHGDEYGHVDERAVEEAIRRVAGCVAELQRAADDFIDELSPDDF